MACTILSLLNDYDEPEVFFSEKIAYNLGRAQAEWANRTALEFSTPHFQQFLLTLNSDGRLKEQILFRDFGDSTLSDAMLSWSNEAQDANLRRPSRLRQFKDTSTNYRFQFPGLDPRETLWHNPKNIGPTNYFIDGAFSYLRDQGLVFNDFYYDNDTHEIFLMKQNEENLNSTTRRHSYKKPSRTPEGQIGAKNISQLPDTLKTLYLLSGEMLVMRLAGVSNPVKLENLERLVNDSKDEILALNNKRVGQHLQSRLIWSGVKNPLLIVKQLETSQNPAELIWLFEEFVSNAEPGSVF